MNSEFQIPIHNIALYDNFDFNNVEIHCTLTYSMINKFLDALKITDYENIIYSIAPSQDFHPLGLFKYKHSKQLNFPTLFYGQLQYFSRGFSYQEIVEW
jgi:hypothetical protein